MDGELSGQVESYIKKNSGVFYKILRYKKNHGLAYVLNRLISSLEVEKYVFRMDADDVCRNDRVSKQLDAFENDKDLMVLGSDLVEINERGRELRIKKMPVDCLVIKKFSISRNPLNHPTVAMRKEFFDIVGIYNENFLKSQDYELWARALKKGVKITNLNEPLLYFRVSSDYVKKRNLYVNSINEFKVSVGLMVYFKTYSQFPKILAKLLVRFMPYNVGKFMYKMLRD